jgi:phosphatidylglycerol lysyltransferase
MNSAQSSTRLKGNRGEAAVIDNAEEVPLHGSNALELEAAASETAQSSPFRRAMAALPWQMIGAVVAFGLFSAVAYVIYHELEGVTWAQVHTAIGEIGWMDVACAIAATAASYIALIGYDFLALRQVGAHNVPLRFIALTSFIAQAFTFSLGFGVLTGGAVRLRLYRSFGLDADRVIAVGILCSLTFWTGLAALAGACLIADPGVTVTEIGLSPYAAQTAGVLVLAAVASWIAYTAIKPRTIEFRDWTLSLPGPRATLASIAVGTADTAAAALALWFILPDSADITFPAFLVVFAVATVLGVLSHVPGGFGIFDAAILLGLPQVPEPAMLASLLVFRLVYYVGPLALSGLMLSIYEVSRKDTPANKGFTALAQIANPLLPAAAAVSVFLGGFVLLISGALPAEADRIAALRRLIPLPFVETSHFVASVVGALLLVVAHGLLRRLKSAWTLAMALLLSGAVFSVAKGFDFEEAIICLAVAGLLYAGRRGFYRQGGFLSGPFAPQELLAVAVATCASIWIGLMVYRQVAYDNSLWWDFAYHGDAPRFLRASLGIAVTIFLLAAYRLMHRAPRMRAPAPAEEMERARAIVTTNDRVEANLATLGDKRFMFANDGGEGFVMYGVQGTSWIAMGDPVTQLPAVAADLVWQFKELVDEHRGVPVFYQVTTPMLPVYLDAGFSLVKLGEEAWVDLKQFTLEGGEGRKLRQTKSKAERSGATLEFVPAEKVDKLIPQLERVSNAWIEERGQREKGFSLGFWSEPYLIRCDLAIVRHEGRIVAFANIWTTGQKEEFSIDLMRHLPDAPQGTMDLLLIGLMEHAKANGYRWFNLGMAPLSGLAQHRLASIWSRAGTFFFRHADRLYNFEGLRAFKNKFKPEWRAKYLAYPGGLSLPQVLLDVTTLISSSPKRAAQALVDVE